MKKELDSLVLGGIEGDETPLETPTPEEERRCSFTLPPEQDYLKSLEESMLGMDNSTTTTQSVRNQMLKKLLPVVDALDMETGLAADPDLLQAQSRLLSEVRGLLNDIDSSAKSQVSMKLKKSDLDTQKQSSINAAEILAQLRLTNDLVIKQVAAKTSQPTKEEIEQHLEEAYSSSELDISDTELEVGGSMLPIHNQDKFILRH